jgi:hypothetical protein
MAILENLENSWDDNFGEDQTINWCKTGTPQFESNPIVETDAMGRERFWEDMGRPEETSLAVKLFSETCCSGCMCGK